LSKRKRLRNICLVFDVQSFALDCLSKGKYSLSDILRDFKKFTSKAVVQKIVEIPESRRKWLLDRFEFAGRYNKKIEYYKFWQDGNEAKEIYSSDFLQQKLAYIHDNPVRAGWVLEQQYYKYSSAIDYSGGKGLIDVIFAD